MESGPVTFTWLNEPPQWREDGHALHVTTGAHTDFWRRTHYGFIRDSGHFRYTSVGGDFTAEVFVAAAYEALYDQAGLMLRVDAKNWLKTGIEYTDGAMHFSTVVTREDFSDWSQQALPASAAQGIGLRLTRHAEALRVQFQLPGESWRPARLAMLPMGQTVDIGMMCCTPERAGLQVTFRDFAVKPAISRALHE